MVCILPRLPAFYLKKWLFEVKWYRITTFYKTTFNGEGGTVQYHLTIKYIYNTSSSSTVFGDLYGSCAILFQPFSRAQQFTAVVSVPGVSRKDNIACPPIPFNPITCHSPLHFVCVSLNSSSFLELQALPSLHHSVALCFISKQL